MVYMYVSTEFLEAVYPLIKLDVILWEFARMMFGAAIAERAPECSLRNAVPDSFDSLGNKSSIPPPDRGSKGLLPLFSQADALDFIYGSGKVLRNLLEQCDADFKVCLRLCGTHGTKET